MNLPLRWKTALAFTLLTAVAFALLDLWVQALVQRNGLDAMRQALLTQARLAELTLPPAPWTGGPALQEAVNRRDLVAEARLTLLAADGTVVADSREDASRMQNHADRPERLEALREGSGKAIRHSATEDIGTLYVALAVPEQGTGDRPVLRLSRPFREVLAASRRLRTALWVSFAVAALLVWFVSLALSKSLTDPIHILLRAARRVERGDLQARAEGVVGPELGELAAVFNAAVSALSETVERSRREGRHWAAILEQMSDAVVILDAGGKIEFVNPAFARFFGVTPAEVEGRAAVVVLSYDLSALLQRAVEQDAVQHDEFRLLRPETRIVAAAVTPLRDERAAVAGAVALLRDVSDRQQLDEMRREFVANASHELRTPAAAVKALAEALEMGALKDPEKGPRFVRQIVEAADRQTTILDDMLTLTRVEMGRQLLHVSSLSAAHACEEAARQLRPTATARGVALEVGVSPTDQLSADAPGLHTVLLNLLDNALKYTPSGGKVTLRGRPAPDGYELSVTDTGIGIPPEHQARIFERFYRVDKARDRATGGTGLGLSIVKHLAEAHGGRVSVRSVVGEGSTFTFFLPAGNGTHGRR